LNLQKEVEAVETEDGIKLGDVCSKPLYPSSSLCNIQVLSSISFTPLYDNFIVLSKVGINFLNAIVKKVPV